MRNSYLSAFKTHAVSTATFDGRSCGVSVQGLQTNLSDERLRRRDRVLYLIVMPDNAHKADIRPLETYT